MNIINEEFKQIHDAIMRESHQKHFHKSSEVIEYLLTPNAAEIYLRDNIRSEAANSSLWFNNDINNAISYDWELGANIEAMLHYRYDIQPIHSGTFFIMYYVFSGAPKIRLTDHSFHGAPGDILLIGPNTSHSVHSMTDDTIVIKYFIRRSTFEKTFFEWLGMQSVLYEFLCSSLYNSSTENFILFHTGDSDTIRELTLMLYAEIVGRRFYYNVIGESKLTELFCRLVRDHLDGILTSCESSQSSCIGRVIAYIQANYATASLDGAASTIGYSRNYLCLMIKKATGKTFTALKNDACTQVAASMLLSTKLTITEIASSVGYHTIKHFDRSFKNAYGMTPLEYRKNGNRQSK